MYVKTIQFFTDARKVSTLFQGDVAEHCLLIKNNLPLKTHQYHVTALHNNNNTTHFTYI
jgi:hypothetical protein